MSGFGLLGGMLPPVIHPAAQDIDNHIRQVHPSYSAWYVGVASDPRQRLFSDHNVDEKNGAWIYRGCGDDSTARAIERHFLDKGCSGGPGGGDRGTVCVYAYLITRTTRE